MPFVKISLPSGLLQSTQNKISKAIHQSLIKEFHIPEDDYFQVINAYKPGQLFYPKSYLGISHTKNMVFVEITAGAGRTVEQKKALYDEIAHSISATTKILAADIIIVLTENNGLENWSFGNGELQEIKHL